MVYRIYCTFLLLNYIQYSKPGMDLLDGEGAGCRVQGVQFFIIKKEKGQMIDSNLSNIALIHNDLMINEV